MSLVAHLGCMCKGKEKARWRKRERKGVGGKLGRRVELGCYFLNKNSPVSG